MKPARIAIAGLGHVGKAFLSLLHEAPSLKLVGVADSSGVWLEEKGLSPRQVLADKITRKKRSQGTLWDVQPHIFIDATPSRYDDALCASPVIDALNRGIHCVLASKGPLVSDWPALQTKSDFHSPTLPALRFGAAIGAAIPSFNIARREFQGAKIQKMEGILNITSQRAFGLLQAGHSLNAILANLQREGITEKFPQMDFDGTDAAAKILILANAVWGTQATLNDVTRQGLTEIDEASLEAARRGTKRLALVATAEKQGETLSLQVKPTLLGTEHALSRVAPSEQAVVFHSNLHGRLTIIGESLGPAGTAATLMRDVFEIAERL